MITNIPKFRCRKYPKGWLVEIQITSKRFFLKNKKWVHAISYSGLPDKPYFFKTKEMAIEDFLDMIKRDLYYNIEIW